MVGSGSGGRPRDGSYFTLLLLLGTNSRTPTRCFVGALTRRARRDQVHRGRPFPWAAWTRVFENGAPNPLCYHKSKILLDVPNGFDAQPMHRSDAVTLLYRCTLAGYAATSPAREYAEDYCYENPTRGPAEEHEPRSPPPVVEFWTPGVPRTLSQNSRKLYELATASSCPSFLPYPNLNLTVQG